MPQQRQNKDLYKFPTERTKGIIATIIFHIVVGLVLVISGFRTPQPIPEEEGILVNFGYDQRGSGILEPVASSSAAQESYTEPDAGETEAVAEILEETIADEQSIPDPVEENMTQDFEEAPVVEKKIEQPDPEEVKRKEAEAERVRLKELEDERIKKEAAEEAERIRQAEEAERIKQAEEARLKREAEELEQRRNDIINRTRNALSNAEGTGTNTNTSQGNTAGEGNQGVETGSVDSHVYEEGSGTGIDGIEGWSLEGRKALSTPEPVYDIQKEGKVVVEITVNREGNVIQAISGVKGSTILDEYLLRVAKDAAMQTKFDSKSDAKIIQKGTITYIFKLK